MNIRPRQNFNQTHRGRLRGTPSLIVPAGLERLDENSAVSDSVVNKVHPMGIGQSAKAKDYKSDIVRPSARDEKLSLPKQKALQKSMATKMGRTINSPIAKTRPDLPKQKRSNVLRRQMLKPPAYKAPIRRRRRSLGPGLLAGLAIMLLAAGLVILFNSLRNDRAVKAQVKQLAQITENDTGIGEGIPSEAKPPGANDTSTYKVSSDLPKLLKIDKINVNARIRRVGVGPNNVLNAPANIFDVGWYDGSAKPGENGTIVLDGHVSGPTKNGVFYSLGTLKEGDKVKIERGDGKLYTFSVTGTELFDNDKVDMNKVLTSSVPGKPGLNMVSSAGRFDVRTNQFEQRIVVYAAQDN